MGLESLNLDLTEYGDRILVLSPSGELGQEIADLLHKRSYQPKLASTLHEALDCSLHELYDLLVIDIHAAGESLEKLLGRLRTSPGLKRTPIIVLHNDPEAVDKNAVSDDNFQLLALPFQPAELLVKVSTRLRMRKIEAQHLNLETQLALQNSQLRELTNRFKQELREAQLIQESLLPTTLPKDSRCVFGVKYLPLEAVGGDWFDIWQIKPGCFGMLIADVTGHGLPAAFIGAMTKMALSYAEQSTPATILRQVNNGLCPLMPEGRFVTAAAVIYNSETGVIQVARAGHPPALLWSKKKGTTSLIKPHGLPLGINVDSEYQLFESTLEDGDKLLLLTDGFTETQSLDGKLLGIPHCEKEFSRLAGTLGIQQCLEEMVSFQKHYSAERILKDDVTLIGLEKCAVLL